MADSAPSPNNVTALAADDGMFSDARIELIRNAVAKGAPDDVFAAMIDLARRRGLDPLAKQMICVPFGNVWQTIVTIDGYRAIAEQTGRYAGSDAPVFTWYLEPVYTSAKKVVPESATVTVYKLIDGQRYPFAATVYWEEFDGKKNNWVSMPRVMLSKVAEAHALRKAFPAVLSGTYTQEEMDQSYVEVSGQMVNRETRVIAERSAPGPSASTRPVPPKHAKGSTRGKSADAGPNTDGKAIHWRGKISALTIDGGWGERDLNYEAQTQFQIPYLELNGDQVESLFRDLQALHDNGDLADYLKEIRTKQHTAAPVEVETVEGEVVE